MLSKRNWYLYALAAIEIDTKMLEKLNHGGYQSAQVSL